MCLPGIYSSPEVSMSRSTQLFTVFLRAVVRRPTLAPEVIRFGLATARPDWMRRMPFAPLPEPAYLEWRLVTAYGHSDHPVTVKEMQEFLEWRRALRRVARA